MGLKHEKQNLSIDTVLNREPVDLLKYASDMVCAGSCGNDMQYSGPTEVSKDASEEDQKDRTAIVEDLIQV